MFILSVTFDRDGSVFVGEVAEILWSISDAPGGI